MGRIPCRLTKSEIEAALAGRLSPIGSPGDLACLLGLSVNTVYEWIAKQRLSGAIRKRGKHVLIWLPRAVEILFNGPQWSEE